MGPVVGYQLLKLAALGIVGVSRKVSGGGGTSLVAKVDASTRRQIASGRTVKLRLTAVFHPRAAGKTVKVTQTLTIRGATRRR